MPAVSKAQQRAAGAELSRRRRGKKRKAFKALSIEKLREFAATRRKGLPKRKRKK